MSAVWGIRFSYKYEAVEIVKETDKTVTYKHDRWGDTRTDKEKMLPWRGAESSAHRLVAKLTSARAEYDRRRKAASDWFKAREAEIFASCDTHPEGGDVKREGDDAKLG